MSVRVPIAILACAFACASAASAQEIERPTWSINDSWTYKVIEHNSAFNGVGRFPSTRKFTITEVRGAHYWADVSTAKEYSTRDTTEEKWGITFNLNNYRREAATLPPTEMEFFRWPLAVGKSWTFSHPTSDGSPFEWHVSIDRWEEITVPAGRFKAIVIKAEGRGNTPYSESRTLWYAPETKMTVKIDWTGYWRNLYLMPGALFELASFKLASTWPIPPAANAELINDYPLTYTARGSGPTLVFVHSVLADYRYGLRWLQGWSANFRVLTVSLRHFYPEKWDGKSNDFTVHQHAKDLIAFIERSGNGPVYLVGWSYGGNAAYKVARERHDLVKKLVLIEGGPDMRDLPPDATGAAVRRARATVAAGFFDTGDVDGGLKFAIDNINGAGTWDRIPEENRSVLRDNAWTMVGWGREEEDKVTCAEFGSLKVPVLLVWGELTSPQLREMVQEQSKCLPGAVVAMIPKAGHSSPALNPPAFKDAVVSFLLR